MLESKTIERLVTTALSEDIRDGDVTSRLVVPAHAEVEAEIISRVDGVIAGLPIAFAVFDAVDPKVRFEPVVKDGDTVKPDQVLVKIKGGARSVFAAERTALNILQHLSGIATLTGLFVKETVGTKAKIFDTRKTHPGLREVEKYAVKVGGGENHRVGLYDAILIKDNHIKAAGGVRAAVAAAKAGAPHMLVEVEVETRQELEEALEAGAEIVLLDNMSADGLTSSVEFVAGRAVLEASGGVSLETVRAIARAGVDRISVGAITQAAPPLDLSLEVVGLIGAAGE